MDNFQQKNNQEQKTRPDRFANPAPHRNLPDPVRLAKIRKKSRRKRQKYLLYLSAALIVLIIGIVLIVRGCSGGGTDPLCGRWDLDGTTVYVFDGKGGGALELPRSRYEFRYEIKDGTVSIDFADDKVRDVSYEFTVGSDELTLERKEKNDTIIHKFKKQTDDRSE